MYMADFLDEKRNEIGARLKELKPLVDEYQRLEAAAAALDGVPTRTAANGNGSGSTRRATARVKAASRNRGAGGGTGRRGRPKGSGTRGAEALALVKGNPGITIPEIAEKMGIKQNYLYRVLPGLAEDGLVKKDGRGWHPKDAA
jgi:sugar-specific transcriptional regulator TrmB